MRAALIACVIIFLSVLWLGPLPELARVSFTAHMTMHMAVVAMAAPLLALAITGSRFDPVIRVPMLGAPIAASMIELVVVWAWHAPALHLAARHHPWAFALEQSTFLVAGWFLWIAAVGGDPRRRRLSAGHGAVALLFTSMHMTLLGALLALAGRPLFQHGSGAADGLALADQHLGGAIMLLIGGATYLIGGLSLTRRLLTHERLPSVRRRESFS